jgi:hypothetical protein
LSRQCCAHLGAKLADNATCGTRCGAFPDCLPAFPATVAREIVQAVATAANEYRAASAVHETLDQLHAAITEGLNGRLSDIDSHLR